MTDTYEITESFEEPFFTGSPGSSLPERTGYPIALEGRGYMLDWASQIPFTRRDVQLLNTQQAQSSGDQSQTPPEIWRRSAESWHMGNGQARFDRDDSLPYRFSASEGVDVWTPWQVSLLHKVSNVQSLDAASLGTYTINGYVIVVKGDTGYWYDTTAGTWASGSLGSSVVDVASDGVSLYVLTGDGKVAAFTDRTTSSSLVGTAVSNWDSSRASLSVLKGFLVLTSKNVVYNATSGTGSIIYTHPNPGWNWKPGVDGQALGYLIGGLGDRWHVFGFPLKNDASTLDPPITAMTLPDGEIPTVLGSYLGFILVGTQGGFRLASADSGGGLTYGRLVDSDVAVECFEGQDRFLWYGRSTSTGTAGLGRADLSTFTAPLTPAVANDLAAPGSGSVTGVATVGDRRMFVVSSTGVFLESATEFVDDGWIEMGGLTFGSTDLKRGTYAQVFYDKMVNAGSIELDYRADGGSWELIGSSVSGVTMGNVPIDKGFTTIEIRIRLSSSLPNHTASPVFTRWETRALVVPGQATEWTVPILIADSIEYEGATEARDVIADYDHLLGLVRTRKNFIFREGTRTWGVFATGFYWMPAAESQNMRAFQGTFAITLKEVA